MKGPRILLVTGKGGVGKSAVAAAAALRLSKDGKRVLLAELGEKSFFQYAFNRPITYQPQQLVGSTWICKWEGEECLREYIAHFLKIERVVNLFFENKVMRALVQAAPALKELAIIGKLTSPQRQVGPSLDFDYIVVDAYSTGHFKALLRAPEGMGEAIPLGPMGEQCREIDLVIKNSDLTHIWVVSLPEELPITETLEHVDFLETEMGLKPRVVLNRVLPTPLEPSDCSQVEKVHSDRGENDFLAYLCTETIEQNRARTLLSEKLTFELPHMFKGISLEMLTDLAERMPHPWTHS